MLDSGSPYLVLYEDAASKFQTIVSADLNRTGFAESSAGRRAIRPCVVPMLEIGDFRMRNVEAVLPERHSDRFEDGFLP